MYSTVHNGEVLDWKFKRMKSGAAYNFSVGHFFLGQIFKLRSGWSAVSWCNPDCLKGFRAVDGFKDRHAAADYLLRVCGMSMRN
jgi:hypothetical protein